DRFVMNPSVLLVPFAVRTEQRNQGGHPVEKIRRWRALRSEHVSSLAWWRQSCRGTDPGIGVRSEHLRYCPDSAGEDGTMAEVRWHRRWSTWRHDRCQLRRISERDLRRGRGGRT